MRLKMFVLSMISFAVMAGAHAQNNSSITPTSGDDTTINQTDSTTTTTTDQDVTNSSSNTVSGDQINNTYINAPAVDNPNSSIRPRGGYDPLRSSDASRRNNSNDSGDTRRDLLRAATPSQREDLVDNQIDREDDAIQADRLMRSTLQGRINAQSINNQAPDTGRLPRQVTGPAANVQFAPQPLPTPIVVVPPVDHSGH